MRTRVEGKVVCNEAHLKGVVWQRGHWKPGAPHGTKLGLQCVAHDVGRKGRQENLGWPDLPFPLVCFRRECYAVLLCNININLN